FRRRVGAGDVERAVLALVRIQQALHAGGQARLQGHGGEGGLAFFLGDVQQAVQNLVRGPPQGQILAAGPGQGVSSASRVSRKARARSHSRLTVRVEQPSSSASSSNSRPAKKRSSTTCFCRGLISPSRSRA